MACPCVVPAAGERLTHHPRPYLLPCRGGARELPGARPPGVCSCSPGMAMSCAQEWREPEVQRSTKLIIKQLLFLTTKLGYATPTAEGRATRGGPEIAWDVFL